MYKREDEERFRDIGGGGRPIKLMFMFMYEIHLINGSHGIKADLGHQRYFPPIYLGVILELIPSDAKRGTGWTHPRSLRNAFFFVQFFRVLLGVKRIVLTPDPDVNKEMNSQHSSRHLT